MAIFVPDISVSTRGATSGAVASAAYLSRSKLVLERTGESYDYTRTHKHERLVHDFGIAAPEIAPAHLLERSALWNEVERVERGDNAQLCRKIMIPLPDELSEEQNIELAQRIIEQRVEQGHIVDAALHINLANEQNDKDYNMHLHIQEPLREIDEKGFKQKSENTYLVRDVAREREQYMSAKELKEAHERGEKWEKVYPYKQGKQRLELTKEQAQERGLDPIKDRVRKQPIQQTRYINAGWNDKERAEEWRSQWAEKMNEALERAGRHERVDHRSYERQGLDLIPQAHEGYKVRALEQQAEREAREQGREYVPVTDVRKANTEIKQTNVVINKASEAIKHLEEQITAIKGRVITQGQSLADKLSQEMNQWRENISTAKRVLFQTHKTPSLAQEGATQTLYKAQEEQRLTTYRHQLMTPSYRRKNGPNRDTNRRSLTQTERKFLTPRQETQYTKQRNKEQEAERREKEAAAAARRRRHRESQSSSSSSISYSQTRTHSRSR